MQNRATYEFAVIRLVPKVEREEFLNVGVILFSKPKKFLAMKCTIDENRLNVFCKALDVSILDDTLKAWQLICEGAPNGGLIGQLSLAERFRWLVASRSTIVQSSKTHPGLCYNPQQVLDDLFEMYVL